MKLTQVIAQVNEEKPNSFSPDKLTSFINEIEAEVREQLGQTGKPYDYKDDSNTDLLAKPPYDKLYKSYLKAMIDYANEEYDSYANNQAQHVSDFQEFVDYVVRTGAVQTVPKRFRNVF